MPVLERSVVFDYSDSDPERYCEYITAEEGSLLSGFQDRARREQSICGRVCLKHLFLLQMDSYVSDRVVRIHDEDLNRFPAWLYRQVSLVRPNGGAGLSLKWCGAGCREVRVSLSHTKAICGASLAAGRGVGVDVESVAARSDGFHRDYYSRAERDWVSSNRFSMEHGRNWLFAILWTFKECALKTGAFGSLNFTDLARLEVTRFPARKDLIPLSGSRDFALAGGEFPIEMKFGGKKISFEGELAGNRDQVVTVMRPTALERR